MVKLKNKLIRDRVPFILLGISIIFTFCKYYGFYLPFFKYLGDIVGYSILTNLFMYSVYMNSKYCLSTKIAVLGLFALNLINLLYLYLGVNGAVYDFAIIIITLLILIFNKIK